MTLPTINRNEGYGIGHPWFLMAIGVEYVSFVGIYKGL